MLQQFQLISARGHFLDTGHPCERAHGGQRAGNHGPLVDTGKNEDRAQVAQAIRLVLHTLRRKNMNLTSKAPKNNLQLRADITAGDRVLQAISQHTGSAARQLDACCLGYVGCCDVEASTKLSPWKYNTAISEYFVGDGGDIED